MSATVSRPTQKWFPVSQSLVSRSMGFCFLALMCVSSLNAQSLQSDIDRGLPDAPSASMPIYPSKAQSSQDTSLRGFPKRFVLDELHIITSPARVRTEDLKWLAPLTAATAVSVGTDTYAMRNVVTKNADFNNKSNTASNVLLGSAIGVPALLFGSSLVTHDERSRETGVLAGEAVVDAIVIDEAIKYAMLRERPLQNDARGHFFVGSANSDPSFVSGHSIMAWSSAAVLASEYDRPWQQIGIYSLASGMSLSRVLAQRHFPTDALLGSAAGWLIGRYVYKAHHSPKLKSH